MRLVGGGGGGGGDLRWWRLTDGCRRWRRTALKAGTENVQCSLVCFLRSHWERTVVVPCLVSEVGEMASYARPVCISTVSCRQPLQARILPGVLQTCRPQGMKRAGLGIACILHAVQQRNQSNTFENTNASAQPTAILHADTVTSCRMADSAPENSHFSSI